MKYQALTKLISAVKSALQKVWAFLNMDVKKFCSKLKAGSEQEKKQASTSTSGKPSANKAKPQSKKKKLK